MIVKSTYKNQDIILDNKRVERIFYVIIK